LLESTSRAIASAVPLIPAFAWSISSERNAAPIAIAPIVMMTTISRAYDAAIRVRNDFSCL
jgi:hypothetical protein